MAESESKAEVHEETLKGSNKSMTLNGHSTMLENEIVDNNHKNKMENGEMECKSPQVNGDVSDKSALDNCELTKSENSCIKNDTSDEPNVGDRLSERNKVSKSDSSDSAVKSVDSDINDSASKSLVNNENIESVNSTSNDLNNSEKDENDGIGGNDSTSVKEGKGDVTDVQSGDINSEISSDNQSSKEEKGKSEDEKEADAPDAEEVKDDVIKTEAINEEDKTDESPKTEESKSDTTLSKEKKGKDKTPKKKDELKIEIVKRVTRSSSGISKPVKYIDPDPRDISDDDDEIRITKEVKKDEDDDIEMIEESDPLAISDADVKKAKEANKGTHSFQDRLKSFKQREISHKGKDSNVIIIDTNTLLKGQSSIPSHSSAAAAAVAAKTTSSVSAQTTTSTTNVSSTANIQTAIQAITGGNPAIQGLQSAYLNAIQQVLVAQGSQASNPHYIATLQQYYNTLGALQDDAYVIEAPSFIVPYVMEGKPIESIKDYQERLRKEMEEEEKKLKEEQEKEKDKSSEKENDKSNEKENDKASETDKEKDMETDKDEEKMEVDEVTEVKDTNKKEKGKDDVDKTEDKEKDVDKTEDKEKDIDSKADEKNVDKEKDIEKVDKEKDIEKVDKEKDVESVDKEKGKDIEKVDKEKDVETVDKEKENGEKEEKMEVDEDEKEKTDDTEADAKKEADKKTDENEKEKTKTDEKDKDKDKDQAKAEDNDKDKSKTKPKNDDDKENKGEQQEGKKDEEVIVLESEQKEDLSHLGRWENYYKSSLGKFFLELGLNHTHEFIQADLLKMQKRRVEKLKTNPTKQDVIAIKSLERQLNVSKAKNAHLYLPMKTCRFCSYKTESKLVMERHLESPHMINYTYKCNFCEFETRGPQVILFHTEAEHNVRGRLERAPAFFQCPLCPFEDNNKSKMTRHSFSCTKKYKADKNCDLSDWEPPAKIPKIHRGRPNFSAFGKTFDGLKMPNILPKSLGGLSLNLQNAISSGLLNSAAMASANSLAGRGRGRPVGSYKNITQTIGNRPGSLMYQNRGSGLLQPMQGVSPQQLNLANQVLQSVTQGGSNRVPRILPASSAGSLLPGLAASSSITIQSVQNKSGNTKSPQQPSISITPLPRGGSQSSGNKTAPTNVTSNNSQRPAFVICEICDGYIKDLEQLRNHMNLIHKVKIHPKMIYNRPPLNCQKCQHRFFTDQGLERHLLGTHGLVTSSMQEAANKGKDAGRCPICGKVFQWKLLNHVSRDHKMTLKPAHLSYKCTVCTATFNMYRLFENHVYSAHSVVNKNKNTEGGSSSTTTSTPTKKVAPVGGTDSTPLKINDEITIIPQPATKSPKSESKTSSPKKNDSPSMSKEITITKVGSRSSSRRSGSSNGSSGGVEVISLDDSPQKRQVDEAPKKRTRDTATSKRARTSS